LELVKRIGTAVVFLPLFALLVARGPRWGFALLVLAVAMVGQWEFCRMVATVGLEVNRSAALAFGTALLVGFYLEAPWPWLLPLLLSVGVGALLASGIRGVAHSTVPGGSPALALLGVLYVNWFLGHLIWLRALPHGVELVFLVVLATWGSDALAYAVGNIVGRHPLCPVVSPKKTIEGTVAGLAGAIIAAFLARAWFYPDLSALHAGAIGALLGVVGLLGDLSESALKRGAGVKDTGGVIPGHGGALDRIDSLLFTTPALYYYARLVLGE
jgi:phosphatidate cytidylyltransferase